MLASSQPGALLITGDLVDGKMLLGRGQQVEEEWQVNTQLHLVAMEVQGRAGDSTILFVNWLS